MNQFFWIYFTCVHTSIQTGSRRWMAETLQLSLPTSWLYQQSSCFAGRSLCAVYVQIGPDIIFSLFYFMRFVRFRRNQSMKTRILNRKFEARIRLKMNSVNQIHLHFFLSFFLFLLYFIQSVRLYTIVCI